jgi:hypothetical protein
MALVESDRFCRKCGTALGEEHRETNGYPSSSDAPTLVASRPASAETAVTPAVFVPAALRPEVKERPSWLIPTLVGAVLVLVSSVAAVILITSHGAAKAAPLSEQAAPVLASVDADVSELSAALAPSRAVARSGNRLVNVRQPRLWRAMAAGGAERVGCKNLIG